MRNHLSPWVRDIERGCTSPLRDESLSWRIENMRNMIVWNSKTFSTLKNLPRDIDFKCICSFRMRAPNKTEYSGEILCWIDSENNSKAENIYKWWRNSKFYPVKYSISGRTRKIKWTAKLLYQTKTYWASFCENGFKIFKQVWVQ